MRNLSLTPFIQAIMLFAGLGSTIAAHAQLPRIVVDGVTAPQVFRDLNAAILAAPANSNITLSGGSFHVPGGFALDKPLHFVGAGMHIDSTNSTGATILTATGSDHFALTSGASGSSFTGIYFFTELYTTFSLGTGAGDQHVTGVELLRCRFEHDVRLGVVEPAASSSTFTECIFHRGFYGNGGTTVADRCIFDWTNPTGGTIAVFQPSGLTMLNSILFGGKTDHCSNATITNCIFTRAGAGPIWQSNNSTVSNCIFSSSDIFSNCTGTAINSITDQVPATIFVNETDGHYQFTDDLHLAGGSPGIGAGSDGNDIGIYGTASPYKPGGVPHVPHIRKVDIARSTDASGNLPATVRVAAQPN